MPKAVVLTNYGPPDVLVWSDVAMPEPGPGQVRIGVKAAGSVPPTRRSGGGTSKRSSCSPPGCARLRGGRGGRRTWALRLGGASRR